MEYQYASNSKGNLGVTLGAIGSGLALLNNGTGILGGLGNNYHNTDGGRYVTKDELDYVQTISAKDSEIALLKSEQNTEIKIADVYERLITRINADARAQADWNSTQAVNNAQMSAAIAVNANSIAALQNCCNNITKIVIPNSSICPGWGQVTVSPVATGTTVG
ncbi:MAG: hypothetical protein MJ235_07715 [archaeon]|nr:hypothetical protein [archaeon]